jgi:hypothetical protein
MSGVSSPSRADIGSTAPLVQPSQTTLDHFEALSRCGTCGQIKGVSEFAVDRAAKSGRRSVCAACRAEYDHHRYLAMTPGLQSYRNRCRAYGLPAVVESFTREQLVTAYGDACYRCGGAFEEIDHVVCVRAGGTHSLENTRPCCARCNQAKYWSVDRPLINELGFRTIRTTASHS